MDNPLSIQDAIDFLLNNRNHLYDSHLLSLKQLFSEEIPDEGGMGLPGTVSLLDELKQQLELVKSLRLSTPPSDSRGLKDLISASTSLFSMYTKLNQDIMNQEKVSRIEKATVEAIKDLPFEAQEAFFKKMELLFK